MDVAGGGVQVLTGVSSYPALTKELVAQVCDSIREFYADHA